MGLVLLVFLDFLGGIFLVPGMTVLFLAMLPGPTATVRVPTLSNCETNYIEYFALITKYAAVSLTFTLCASSSSCARRFGCPGAPACTHLYLGFRLALHGAGILHRLY